MSQRRSLIILSRSHDTTSQESRLTGAAVDGKMIVSSLPFWVEAFAQMLQESNEAVSDVGLKTEVCAPA